MTITEVCDLLDIAPGKILEGHTGNYSVIRPLGIGKNNIVCYVLCVAGQLQGCFFATKIQYNLEGKRVKRFFREVSFMRQHHHPNALTYFDDAVYVTKGRAYPFVIVQCIPSTLDEYLQKDMLTTEKKIKFACQLASVLVWLKKINVIHRDIKPQNILTDGENAYLGDFGLIKNLAKEWLLPSDDFFEAQDILTASDTMPRFYRTPELIKFAKKEDILRVESDTYQLGLVYGDIFTGRNPLQPSQTKLDALEIQLSPVCGIDDIQTAAEIENTIRMMLREDYHERILPEEVLARMTSVASRFLCK